MCPSFVLGGDANTGSAGYVCLETELMGWESEFYAAMLAAFAFAAFLGWPSCTVADCPAVLCYAALSEVVGRFWVPAAMLVWAALSDGYGGRRGSCCESVCVAMSCGGGFSLLMVLTILFGTVSGR